MTINQNPTKKLEYKPIKDIISKRKMSLLKEYQNLAVGDFGLINTLKYEFITDLFGGLPGALGLYLRKKIYKYLFTEIGKNVIFGKNILLARPLKIKMGNYLVIGNNCHLDVRGDNNAGMILGNSVTIGHNTVLRVRYSGTIQIGNNTTISDNCWIFAGAKVKIGDNVRTGPSCYLIGGHGWDIHSLEIARTQPTFSKGLTVGDNVWLGAGVKVLDGVNIGKDSRIGAGAVVTKDIPECSVAYGVPAKVIKHREAVQQLPRNR